MIFLYSFPFQEKELNHTKEFQFCPLFTLARNVFVQLKAKQRISVRMTYDHRIFTYRKGTLWVAIEILLLLFFSMRTKLLIEPTTYFHDHL